MASNDRPGRVVWNWRQFFTQSTLKYAQADYASGKIKNFAIGEDGTSASGTTAGGFKVAVSVIPHDYQSAVDYPRWDRLTTSSYYKRSSDYFSNYYSCSCSQGQNGTRCRHLANLMFCWEHEHGRFVFEETEEAFRARMAAERAARERAQKEKAILRAWQALPPRPAPEKPLFFDCDKLLRETEVNINQYQIDEAERMVNNPERVTIKTAIAYNRDGQQVFRAKGRLEDHQVEIILYPEEVSQISCDCVACRVSKPWYSGSKMNGLMCGHALAMWYMMREYIYRENPGDSTDYQANTLLSMMTSRAAEAMQPEVPRVKAADVVLSPRIVAGSGADYRLTFDIGRAGGRMYVLKSLESLKEAVDGESVMKITSKAEIDFSREALSEASLPWYDMILRQVNSTARFNQRIKDTFQYYSLKLPVSNSIPMQGRELDQIYELAQGGNITYQYGARSEAVPVRVGPVRPKAKVKLMPVMKGRQIAAIRINGDMSQLLTGEKHRYMLDRQSFGQVPDQDMGMLEPFSRIADARGHFDCVVGDKRFAELYYRILPQLQRSEQIVLEDKVGDKLDSLLPPEPEFTFYIDLDGLITCRAKVDYAGQAFELGFMEDAPPTLARDRDQERRVEAVVGEFFPWKDSSRKLWTAIGEDDTLMSIMTQGVAALSAYGTVNGSDAFRQVHIRPVPKPSVSLRVEGGLLDLAIQTKDCSNEELLELLNSYRQKRRWHRLHNGDFVDLSDPSALEELEETVEALDVSPEVLLREGAKVPKYRALYVDKLLEAHDDIAAARDRQFKALVRSFRTIKDSDFEVPENLSEVLRSYQKYGFRWLNTLAASGFGGILADEMGLGKTLQLLAFIQSKKAAGESRPALVVCPASLVYNWREECRRFTPDLTVQTLDGTLPTRKKLFKAMKGEDRADLYVTSYDLMKRDITFYDDITFSTVALDEAQYVKNQKTAVSKAVRVLKAEYRFALTGTPIENRLSELWSIFDFLMPGFLYASPEFQTRFENPIMKQGDQEATARLSRMTEPFILRRRKADVLKDLPEKLEETRASAMEPDQRRLYDAQVVHMRKLLEASSDSNQDKMRVLSEITRLRQLCCDPSLIFEDYKGSSTKRAACLELIQNAIDGGHRMLVFSQFTSMLELLKQDLSGAGIPFYTITGATPKQERIGLVNRFNEGDVPVFLISLKAGGTGLNLTGADVVIHYDPWWNLAVQNQATDRAHRIGQTRQVTVIRLIAAETIEEKIIKLQEAKRELAESIISSEGGSLMSFTREELLELLG